MIMVYPESQFKEDKKELLKWIDDNWTYTSPYGTYFGNILRELRGWVEALKRIDK